MTRVMLGLLGAAALLPAQDTQTQEPPRQVRERCLVRPVRGDIWVWRAEAKKLEASGAETRVMQEDRVGTPRGEYGMFLTEGGVAVSLKGVKVDRDRGLSVERSGGRLVIKLYEGRMVLDVRETDLVIETPHGRVESRKAYFVIDVTVKGTKVVVIEGTLAFTNSLGTVELGPEQESFAAKDKKPTVAQPTELQRELKDFLEAERSQNLLRNGGLEEGLEGWGTSAYKGVTIHSIDDRISYTGRRSIRFDITSAKVSFEGELIAPNFMQDVNVVPGWKYLVRAFFRVETREGEPVIPLLCIKHGERKTESVGPAEKVWRLTRMTFAGKESKDQIFLCFKVKSKKFDFTVWADEFCLIEIPQ